jgi:4-hydroxybutyrate CoA-transferase
MPENWREEYKRKFISAEEAVRLVKSGDRVAFTYGREPLALGLALLARRDELQHVRTFVRTPSRDLGWYDAGWEEAFDITISYVLPIVREAMAERRVDFLPGTLLGITTDCPVVNAVDVLLIELSPPDEHGFCSFGASVWGKKRAVQCAKTVIAEVNENLIRTYGDNFIHVSEIDYFAEHVSSGALPGGSDLLGRKTQEPGQVEKAIAGYVGSLVNDGNCLQIGVGSTSEWVARLGVLDDKIDLGWHSETTPRGAIKLACGGVITGKRKNINQNKFIAIAIGGGDEEDMRFVNGNPMFELHDADYVLNPRIISANDNVLSINSAVAIDLTGLVAAESIGPVMVSGSGGQLAFAVGAQLSAGGRFISTLPSTAKGRTISRIVSRLPEATVVTVPRTLTDIVVTEYGIARLRGKSQRERALELINVAHPDFRTELKKEAEELFWP